MRTHHQITFISPVDGHSYAFDIDLTEEQASLIKGAVIQSADRIINSIPTWVVDLGLVRPWCFLQDMFNFRNPFRR